MRQADPRTRELLDRVEARLPLLPIREVAMFGSHAIMLADSLVAAVFKDHDLLVRVLPDDDAVLLQREEASRPVMGGREMGAGWLRIDGGAVDSDETLDFWVDQALVRFDEQQGGAQA